MPGCTSPAEWTCPPLPHRICRSTRASKRTQPRRRRRPRQTRPRPPPPLQSSRPPVAVAPSPPSRSIAQGAVMDRHVAMTPSRSEVVSAALTRVHLIRGRAYGASAAIAAAAMPWSPCRRRADTARRPVLYVPGQCLKVRHGHVAWGILVEVVVRCLAGGHCLWRRRGEGGSCVLCWACEV